MHKLAVAFITFVIVIVAEVKCENLHLFGIVGPDAFRPGDAEMHRSYSLHNLNMMASLNHMKDRIAQKEPYFKRCSCNCWLIKKGKKKKKLFGKCVTPKNASELPMTAVCVTDTTNDEQTIGDTPLTLHITCQYDYYANSAINIHV
uniref:RNAse_Pc domain-containing protein n=1 Tax=Syphacia muris TaxID=451379 RepID=A0A0N5ADC7_9BILA